MKIKTLSTLILSSILAVQASSALSQQVVETLQNFETRVDARLVLLLPAALIAGRAAFDAAYAPYAISINEAWKINNVVVATRLSNTADPHAIAAGNYAACIVLATKQAECSRLPMTTQADADCMTAYLNDMDYVKEIRCLRSNHLGDSMGYSLDSAK